jgi:Icc protein
MDAFGGHPIAFLHVRLRDRRTPRLKFALITDTHLVRPGRLAYGLDPLQRLSRVIDAIRNVAPDIDRLVVLGDLADEAELEAYAALLQITSVLSAPVTYLVGNHDDRERARSVLPPENFDPNGFVQSAIACDFAQFLFLDTVLPGSHAGAYCEMRKEWLKVQLRGSGTRDVYVFQHHPITDAGTDIDHLKLDPNCGLAEILREHGRVRHIFCGHVHRTISGAFDGLSWTALHGTNQQTNAFYRDRAERLQDGPSQVALVSFAPGRHTMLFHDALDRHLLIPPTTASAIGAR